MTNEENIELRNQRRNQVSDLQNEQRRDIPLNEELNPEPSESMEEQKQNREEPLNQISNNEGIDANTESNHVD